MKTYKVILVISMTLEIPGMAIAHGPGGSGQSYEADAPVIKFGGEDPFSSLPVTQSDSRMIMSVEGQRISLQITSQYGDPVVTDLAEAKAFVTSGGKTSWLRLTPAGGNTLSGEGDFIHTPGMRVDITLRLPGKKPVNQEFYPLQRR